MESFSFHSIRRKRFAVLGAARITTSSSVKGRDKGLRQGPEQPLSLFVIVSDVVAVLSLRFLRICSPQDVPAQNMSWNCSTT